MKKYRDANKHKDVKVSECGNIREFFRNDLGCQTWNMTMYDSPEVRQVIDHAFVVDRAAEWGADYGLDGSEVVIISRSYAPDNILYADYPGVEVCELKYDWLLGNMGKLVAVKIVGPGDAAESLLKAFRDVPAELLAYVVSLDMQYLGWGVVTAGLPGRNYAEFKLTNKWESSALVQKEALAERAWMRENMRHRREKIGVYADPPEYCDKCIHYYTAGCDIGGEELNTDIWCIDFLKSLKESAELKIIQARSAPLGGPLHPSEKIN